MLRRTIHAAKYLSDPAYRRKIARQLNKGESLHSLRRDLHYAHRGTIQKPHLTEQTEQAWCLTVPTNAVVTWSTEYYSLAVAQLRAAGRDVSWPTSPRPTRRTSISSVSSPWTWKPSSRSWTPPAPAPRNPAGSVVVES